MLEAPEKSSFYSQGLHFSCKRCSSCCRYDSGFVYLCEKDLEKLSTELGMDRNAFVDTYCRWVVNVNGKEALSLRERSNKDCILWDSGCLVYLSRPLQCSSFPFWESIVCSDQTWNIAACTCPGMNCGETHSERTIEEHLITRKAEPVIYR